MGARELPGAAPVQDGDGRDKGSTAFYALAEHLRLLSGGRVNHKMLYSLVGTNGYYVNHKNPSIRKRAAASLSRLVHSSRYAVDFQRRCAEDPEVLARAADAIVALLLEMGHETPELDRALRDVMWPDVEDGLVREGAQGRSGVSPRRIANEMGALFRVYDARPDDAGGDKVRQTMMAFLQMVTFGHLEPAFAHGLVGETPLAADAGALPPAAPRARADCACLVRCSSLTSVMLGDFWLIRAGEPFVIGRFADCSAIESDPAVSRRHCRIERVDVGWQLEDLGSRNGTRLFRGGAVVFDSTTAPDRAVRLEHDDTIVLAGRERYWFGLFGEEPSDLGGAACTMNAAR